LEYRGVDLQTGEEIFHQHFAMGTNNVGEFLAIVHGLAYCSRENGSPQPVRGTVPCPTTPYHQPTAIYTDSKTAMSWVKQGKCKSKFRTTAPERAVRKIVDRAEEWLKKS
jgi:ribonuclease HI